MAVSRWIYQNITVWYIGITYMFPKVRNYRSQKEIRTRGVIKESFILDVCICFKTGT